MPNAIANAPELWLGLELFFAAFMDLTGERAFGFAEGPIPWSATRRYCREHGIIGDQCEDLHYHVSKLDSVYLEHRSKQAKKSQHGNERPRIIRPENAGSGPRGSRER